MSSTPPTIERDGWTLLSAEDHNARYPDTFFIPPRHARESLSPGDAVQLMFDIETREGGRVIDRGVDRMWVILKRRSAAGGIYEGVLDSDPGRAENVTLHPGTEVNFGPEHVIAIERPPEGYVLGKYGPSFFD